MEITNVGVILGKNEWGPPPVLEARLETLDSSAFPGGEGWVSSRLADLLSTARSDASLETDDPRTATARVVGQLAIIFQRLAGSNATFVATRMTDEQVALLAFDFKNEALARAALDAAMKLYEATRDDRPFPFAETIQELRSIANLPEATPTRAAMFPSSPRAPIISIPYTSASRAG